MTPWRITSLVVSVRLQHDRQAPRHAGKTHGHDADDAGNPDESAGCLQQPVIQILPNSKRRLPGLSGWRFLHELAFTHAAFEGCGRLLTGGPIRTLWVLWENCVRSNNSACRTDVILPPRHSALHIDPPDAMPRPGFLTYPLPRPSNARPGLRAGQLFSEPFR
jgi:hypothetical protein